MTSVTPLRSISPEDLARDIGITFSKPVTIAAADYDKYLGEINNTLFKGEEVFGWLLILDDPSATYALNLELVDGTETTIAYPAWTLLPVRAKKILSAGTTATSVTVLAGQ